MERPRPQRRGDPVTTRRIRRTARIIGVTAAAPWILLGVLGAFGDDHTEDAVLESVLLAAFVLIAAGGVGIALRNESIGGIVTLGAGISLAVFAAVTAGRNQWLAVLVSGVPFIVAGSLFLVCRDAHRAAPD